MKKEQLIDLAILQLNGGIPISDGKAKYHPEEVEKWLEVAFDDYIVKTCALGMETGDLSGLDSFTKPFEDIAVLNDANREEYYAVLPIPTVQLPQMLAIRQVSPMKAPTRNFRYTQYSQQAVMGSLDVGQIGTEMKYYVENSADGENDRIRFWQGFDPIYTSILVRMVVPFAYLNNKSEIAIPTNKAMEIIAMVAKIMGDRKGVPPDTINDNFPTN
jgi:hypothetical protein